MQKVTKLTDRGKNTSSVWMYVSGRTFSVWFKNSLLMFLRNVLMQNYFGSPRKNFASEFSTQAKLVVTRSDP